ncbi:glycosyltransferase family 2 protein [Agrobacterium sp. BA1120]|uniref:glycosyltransferase family 2 protein n=1 Tax=Agrobacterium sp. BA1120 TaxID=3228927 RepID=UPI00336A1BF3
MAKVSIGLPTLNGFEFIGDSLKCLQEQTFEDFEVAISDNGSTDGTSEICADFARRDKRFHHFRLEQTIPWLQNFTRVRDLLPAPYYMWRADDDLAAPNYLECLVRQLDQQPEADIAVAKIRRIIEEPVRTERVFELPYVPEEAGIERMRQLLLNCHPSWFYGLWRRETVVRDWDRVTERYQTLWASDHLALLPSILDGKVSLALDTEFIQRIKRPNPIYKLAPEKLLQARAKYEELAVEMMDCRDWPKYERRQANGIVQEHIKRCVARRPSIQRRFLKKIKSLIFLG